MDDKRQMEVRIQQQVEYVPTMALSLDEAAAKFKELEQFIKSQMHENEDYGRIPGCPKPSLFKPGAEKLAILYGFSPRLEILKELQDWDKGFFYYEIKCTLVSKRSGHIVAEGIGSCNSKEKKYRNSDAFTLDNVMLKMAKKRALVDAVLTATRTSGLFTQDVEDLGGAVQGLPEQEHHEVKAEPYHVDKPLEEYEVKPKAGSPNDTCSDKQQKAIYAISKRQGMSNEEIKEMLIAKYNVESSRDLTKKQASELIDSMQ